MRLITRTMMLVGLSASMPAYGGQNPDQPSRGDWDFTPKKVWEIDRVGDQPLARPAELRVSPHGSFYFHDFEHHVSYACDAQGGLVRKFAKQGHGKGEVSRYMNCLAVAPGFSEGTDTPGGRRDHWAQPSCPRAGNAVL